MPENNSASIAAAHWEALAAYEVRMAAWYVARGLPFGSVDSYYCRARTYLRTASALRREAETGRAHCSACGGAHAPHEHPSLPTDACRCPCGSADCLWCGGAAAMTTALRALEDR